MCMRNDRLQQLVHECCREMIMDGNSEYTPYEWSVLEDAYIRQTDVFDCASGLQISEQEVERIYQMFSLHVVAGSFREYLGHA